MWDLSYIALASRTKKSKDDSDSSDEDYSKEEDIWLFVKRYNQYFRKHKLKYFDKNMINFKKSHPHKEKHKRKDEDITCFEYGKSDHHRTKCPSLNKHHKKKDSEFYTANEKYVKDRRAYIT